MELTKLSLRITPEDLRGREQVWIDFGAGGLIHLCMHENEKHITAWLRKLSPPLRKRTCRIGKR